MEKNRQFCRWLLLWLITHRMHVWYIICTYIYFTIHNQPFIWVYIYTSPMDPSWVMEPPKLCRWKPTWLRVMILPRLSSSGKKTNEPRKNPLTFHYTGCLIGILIMVYYNHRITGYNWVVCHPLYNPTNRGFE